MDGAKREGAAVEAAEGASAAPEDVLSVTEQTASMSIGDQRTETATVMSEAGTAASILGKTSKVTR